MRWWVYKCRDKPVPGQRTWGDWEFVFGRVQAVSWGTLDEVPALQQLRAGDKILAYQTDRNELVGIAVVTQGAQEDGHVYLKPERRVGVKVRPLKQSDRRIAEMPAWQQGPVQTLYEITNEDAEWLLEVAEQHGKG